jgi:hypothetical protein
VRRKPVDKESIEDCRIKITAVVLRHSPIASRKRYLCGACLKYGFEPGDLLCMWWGKTQTFQHATRQRGEIRHGGEKVYEVQGLSGPSLKEKDGIALPALDERKGTLLMASIFFICTCLAVLVTLPPTNHRHVC